MPKLDYLVDLPGVLTAKAFAAKVGVSSRQVYRMVEEDKLFAYRIGPILAIPESELSKFENRISCHERAKKVREIMAKTGCKRPTAYKYLRDGR